MKIEISEETSRHLQIIFTEAVEQVKYSQDEYPQFIEDLIYYGMIVTEKIISGQVEEDVLSDADELIILNKENLFSEN